MGWPFSDSLDILQPRAFEENQRQIDVAQEELEQVKRMTEGAEIRARLPALSRDLSTVNSTIKRKRDELGQAEQCRLEIEGQIAQIKRTHADAVSSGIRAQKKLDASLRRRKSLAHLQSFVPAEPDAL